MKKLALFDIDGVIHGGHHVFELIQDMERRGIIPKETWNKILVELNEYKQGRKNYKQMADFVLEVSAKSVQGKNYNDLLKDTYEYMLRNKDKFFPYFEKIVPSLGKKYDIYFVTTNFQFIPEAIGKIFGVKNYLSSIAEVKNGKFTGKVELSLGGNKGIVADLISRYGKEGSFAVGDSENDADMLDKVEHPFVMEPNDKLTEIASKNGWQVVNRDTIQEKLLSLV